MPRKYPQELRDRAVRTALESDRPIAQIAREIGVHREALRTWVRQAKTVDEPGKTTKTSKSVKSTESTDTLSADAMELSRLRRENTKLKKDNEMLKAASVFYAVELSLLWGGGGASRS
ncbi:transposase [Actinomadura meridiana]|uniref:transposase n=1 Tax=Actinomadura meridiana TaxID=559626 RepID=UPI0031EA7DAB